MAADAFPRALVPLLLARSALDIVLVLVLARSATAVAPPPLVGAK